MNLKLLFVATTRLPAPGLAAVLMVKALKAADDSLKFIVDAEAGHDFWSATCDNPDFYSSPVA